MMYLQLIFHRLGKPKLALFFTGLNQFNPIYIFNRFKASQSEVETLIGGTEIKVANELLTFAYSW